MRKSALVIDMPKNCYECPFGTEYCGNLEYEGCCELADCLDYDAILMTEEHYDYESESRPDWCPLKLLPDRKEITETYKWEDRLPSFKCGWNWCLKAIIGEK